MSLNLVYISSGQYPNGGAASIRHLSFARGLTELGNKVSFILLSEQVEKSIINGEYSLYNEIKLISIYKNSINKVIRKIKRRLYSVKIWKTNREIKKLNDELKIDALIILDINHRIINPIISYCNNLNILVFHERTEYPFVVKGSSNKSDKNLEIYLNHTINRFDGIYVINNTLNKYFHEKTNNKVPIKTILMTVEPDRFENDFFDSPFEFDYLAYCGSMYGDKDGVPILIKAFSLIEKKWPKIKLVLIGDTNNKVELANLKILVSSLGLDEKIVFTGRILSEDMPRYLNNAMALCLARPNNKQAEGGFPTKLGEYLATKKPTVVTNVGEISNYLKDGFHAFIAEPDSEFSFSEKLNFVLGNYEYAQKIAIQGNLLVHELFNYKVQAKELIQFFKTRE